MTATRQVGAAQPRPREWAQYGPTRFVPLRFLVDLSLCDR